MILNIKGFLASMLAVVISGANIGPASAADSYPSHAVKIVVPYAPGGPVDTVGRKLAEQLEKRLKQPFVVENKSGANGIIAARAVMGAPNDGYTLFLHAGSSMDAVFNKEPVDILKELTPVISIYASNFVLFISSEVPAKTHQEFVEYAKANPGKVKYAAPAPTTMLSMEAFASRAGIKLVSVPYRGAAPATLDLLSNTVQAVFTSTTTMLEHVKAGKVRAIGIGGSEKQPLLPDVPLLADAYPGFETVSNVGISVAVGTPKEIVALLNKELNAVLATQEMKDFLIGIGGFATGGPPEHLHERIRAEIKHYAETAKAIGYKVE